MSSYCRNVYISIIGQIDRKLLMFTYNSTLNSQRCYGRDQEIQWSHPRLSRHESFSVLRQRPRRSLRPHYQGGTRLWILCSQSWRAVVYVTCVILAMLLSELLLSEWLLCTTLHDNILWCHVCHISLHNIQQCMHVLIYNYVLPTLCFQRCVSCDLNMIILVESTTDYCYQLPMCSFKQEVCRGHLLA